MLSETQVLERLIAEGRFNTRTRLCECHHGPELISDFAVCFASKTAAGGFRDAWTNNGVELGWLVDPYRKAGIGLLAWKSCARSERESLHRPGQQ